MSNMSYCRYENTLSDLRDCYNALQEEAEDGYQEDAPEELSEYEARAKKQLIDLCATITAEFGEEDQ